jgi:hypothetical protein
MGTKKKYRTPFFLRLSKERLQKDGVLAGGIDVSFSVTMEESDFRNHLRALLDHGQCGLVVGENGKARITLHGSVEDYLDAVRDLPEMSPDMFVWFARG